MPWLLRGLRDGVVTSGWPRRRDAYFDGWSGVAEGRAGGPPVDEAVSEQLVAICPTAAIQRLGDHLSVDQGACIGCGRCIDAHPEEVSWRRGADLARLSRPAMVAPVGDDEENLAALRAQLARRTTALGRSVHIRHVDAGSDGAEEWEIAALLNPVYDIHRLGLFFTASPRHADILLVTGIGTTGMQSPLGRTLEAMPRPVVVVAVGTDACSGGLWKGSYASCEGVGNVVPVDVWVPGSPPPPFAILHGLLLALGRVPMAGEGGST